MPQLFSVETGHLSTECQAWVCVFVLMMSQPQCIGCRLLRVWFQAMDGQVCGLRVVTHVQCVYIEHETASSAALKAVLQKEFFFDIDSLKAFRRE